METSPKPARRGFDRRRFCVRLLLILAIAVFSSYHIGQRIPDIPRHGDEAMWILAANYHTELLVRGDFTHAHWVANHLLDVGNINPQLGKLLLGLGIRLHPQRQPGDAEYLALYDWSKPMDWNRENGLFPNDALLFRARSAAAVFTIGIVVLLFIIGTTVAHEAVGLIAVTLFLASDWMLNLLSRAMTDSHYNFFLLCGLLAGIGLARSATPKAWVAWSALVGLAAALACSVKVIGLPVLGLFYVPLWLYVTIPKWPGKLMFALGPAVFGIAGVVPVYLLNPFLWPTESWTIVWEFPRMFLRWREMLTSLPGNRWGEPPDRFGLIHGALTSDEVMIAPGELIFVLLGGGLCLYFLIRAVRGRKVDALGVLLIYVLAQYGFILAMLQFHWKRYYLPTLLPMKLLAGVGMAVPVILLIRYLTTRRAAIAESGPDDEG